MSRGSLKASKDGIDKAKKALTHNGLTQKALAEDLAIARSTVSKFFNGHAVERSFFQEICSKLGLNWKKIFEIPLEKPEPEKKNQDNGSDIDELVQEVRSFQLPSRVERVPFISPSGSGDLNPSFRWEPGQSPDSRYELTPTGMLKITAGAYTDRHNLDDSAPLVIYPFDGNFEVRIQVKFSSTTSFQRAGIGIRSASNKYTYFRINLLENGLVEASANQLQHGKQVLFLLKYKNDTIHFKIKKQGKYFSPFYSCNGIDWLKPTEDCSLEMPTKVEIFIDVFSAHNSNKAAAEFSDFLIMRI
jgi:transcriptional regulator with XRE-family HTH domain/regulation of enolase protein 1 (concanavalin A-like superfamily)